MESLKILLGSDDKVTILAGAGISMDPPSNLSSARQIMVALIKYSCIEKKQEIILNIPELRYEYIVQTFRDHFDINLRILDYFAQSSLPNRIHKILANLIFHECFVLTTNFDYLIEHALVTN